jgi:hypothetical protein
MMEEDQMTEVLLWYDSLREVAPFDPILDEDEQDLLSCQLGDDMTVQSCEETLIWSVLVNQSLKDMHANTIAQAVAGMRRVAKGCLVDDRVQVNPLWKQYASDFEKRFSVGPDLNVAYPFLRAIVFALNFSALCRKIRDDLQQYRPGYPTRRRGMCDVGNVGGAVYLAAVEDRRQQLARENNDIARHIDCHEAWIKRIEGAASPRALIYALKMVSAEEIPISGMRKCATRWLHRIDAGRF